MVAYGIKRKAKGRAHDGIMAFALRPRPKTGLATDRRMIIADTEGLTDEL